MFDRQINLGCVVAWAMWVITAALLIAAGLVFDHSSHLALMLSSFGLAFSAASATVTIRHFFVVQNEMMRNAFELGRDSGATVRRMTR